MKTLLLLRHAKAESEEEAPSDHARRLTERGARDARKVGEWLRDSKLLPDAIVSSTAARARQTAELAAASGDMTPSIGYRDDLYLAPPAAYVDIARSLPDDAACALMVGHNGGIEELASILSGSAVHMATAAIVHLQFAAHRWSEVRLESSARLVEHWRPEHGS